MSFQSDLGLLKTDLGTTNSPTGLAEIVGGEDVLASQFDGLTSAMVSFEGVVDDMIGGQWVGTDDLAAACVSAAKFRSSAALSVVGNATNASASVADISAGTDGYVLRRSGTTLGFGTVASAGIATGAVSIVKEAVRPVCRLNKTADESIANNTTEYLTFTSTDSAVVVDPYNMHSPTTNSDRITVSDTGFYLVTAYVQWDSNATGKRGLYLQKNSSSIIGSDFRLPVSGSVTMQTVSVIVPLAANDWVRLGLYQSSGAALDSVASNGAPSFSVAWMGKSS